MLIHNNIYRLIQFPWQPKEINISMHFYENGKDVETRRVRVVCSRSQMTEYIVYRFLARKIWRLLSVSGKIP